MPQRRKHDSESSVKGAVTISLGRPAKPSAEVARDLGIGAGAFGAGEGGSNRSRTPTRSATECPHRMTARDCRQRAPIGPSGPCA